LSNPICKAERSKAKDIRQGVIEQRPQGRKSTVKVHKPIQVECKWVNPTWRENKEWRNWKKYRSVEDAEVAMANMIRKHPNLYELRIKGGQP
jgi:hypothetical protein